MKIKNIKCLLVLVLLNFGCNDEFMDRFPPDKVNDANYWKTPGDLRTFANQFYPDLITSGNWTKDNMTDNQAPANRIAFVWNEYVVPASGGNWGKSDWADIRSCNFFLQRYQTVEGDPEEIGRYVGEVKFFRAWYYFDKVRMFGDVPWLNQDLNIDSEELFIERTSRKTVVDSILQDLDDAIGQLPETSGEERLTKYAAQAFKSRVALYEGTWRKYHNLGDFEGLLQQAVGASQEVINSGMFELYTTGNPQKDYNDLFVMDDLAGNKEAIMFKRYTEDLLMHNRVRQLGEAGSGFTKDFVDTYLDINGLPISISNVYEGESVSDYLREFRNRDPRMRQTVYTPDQPYHITDDGEIQYQHAPQFDNGMTFTGYRIYKMFSPTQRDFEYQRNTIDEFIFRYAEVLLNFAEAKAELGELTQQDLDDSINLLRERAGMPGLTPNVGFVDPDWPAWEVSISALLNEIRRERRIELAAEGFRFDDLMRWSAGRLLENPETYLGALDPETAEFRVLYPGRNRVWIDKLYLYPIPSQEIALNPNISQNPGWTP